MCSTKVLTLAGAVFAGGGKCDSVPPEKRVPNFLKRREEESFC